jgi:hypothetical protein
MPSRRFVLSDACRSSEDQRPVPRRRHGGGGDNEQHEYRDADSAKDSLSSGQDSLLILARRTPLRLEPAADRNDPSTGRVSHEAEQQQSQPAGNAAEAEPKTLRLCDRRQLKAARVAPIQDPAGRTGEESGDKYHLAEAAIPKQVQHESLTFGSSCLCGGLQEQEHRDGCTEPEGTGEDVDQPQNDQVHARCRTSRVKRVAAS